MDKETETYFAELKNRIANAYEVANRARVECKDPDINVEALSAGDLAARVEGLVGPEGIASRIREVGRGNISGIVDYILGDISHVSLTKREKEARMDQAIRTALAIITEGVVAAPIEGISKICINSNPDGSDYLSVYFAGPIRSAGGTAQGYAVVISDYIRKRMGLKEYRPTDDELERCVEEIKVYNNRVSRLQYVPNEDDIRHIVRNVPLCIDGDPTGKEEVSIHKDIKRVETNRIRGGMCLVIAEGIAQKAKRLMKHATNLGLDWNWLSEIKKIKDTGKEAKPSADFMSEIVGGRPIFAAPSAKGGFRLRYGRSRTSGIAGKSIHPATMLLLDEFIATGTQVKVERPGKGCIITECSSIEGPVIKLKNGSVMRIENIEQARMNRERVSEIIFVGDILITYGDFLQTNSTLLPAGYCEEYWIQEVKEKLNEIPDILNPNEAVDIAKKYEIPLHPRYIYHWEDIDVNDTLILVEWLCSGCIAENALIIQNNNKTAKRILEILCVPHNTDNNSNSVLIDEYSPLLHQLGIYDGVKISRENFDKEFELIKGQDSPNKEKKTAFDLVERTSLVKVRKKVGTYIGARMGRPEKAKERKMEPPVHALFPIGWAGGKERSINSAAERNFISVEIARYECPNCKISVLNPVCPRCRNVAVLKDVDRRDLEIGDIWKRAVERVGTADVKGVHGMISRYKIPEPLEKGILRAKNGVYVFKDGTIRFDATDAPLTHFKPSEIMVGIEKLRELGYTRDYLGNELSSDEQIIEIRIQDVVIPIKSANYFVKVAHFMDELLRKFYGIEPFYNVVVKEDLFGHLIVGLAPHTSAGIVGRIVGFTRANVCFAHPYWHAAKRRNCDGDEDAIMLLMDTLINFSRKYLPEKRGGQMDAPLVISTILDPKEVDDEVHKMEIVDHYPLEFYKKTWECANPSDVHIATVGSVLDNNPYSGLRFTHDTNDINGPVLETRYVKLKTMREKVDAQLKVAEKVMAVNEREVAELVINSHLIRDTYGNLRAFVKQKFRCVKCNKSYRRIPLVGKCTACGGKLLLTVSEGSVRKYLDISTELVEKYNLSDYMKQRLVLLKREIDSLFTNDLSKQAGLADFM